MHLVNSTVFFEIGFSQKCGEVSSIMCCDATLIYKTGTGLSDEIVASIFRVKFRIHRILTPQKWRHYAKVQCEDFSSVQWQFASEVK